MTGMTYADWREKASLLLEQANLSGEDARKLLLACSIPIEELPAKMIEAHPILKWLLAQEELQRKDGFGGELIDWQRMCELLEEWSTEMGGDDQQTKV